MKRIQTNALAALCLALAFPAVAHADDVVYTVRSGDRLSTIARAHDVTVEQIREWNDLDGDLIRVGQDLELRTGASSSSSGGWTTYTIRSGDRLSSVARAHGVSVDDIVEWNRGLDPDRIRSGQEIRIREGGSRSSRSTRSGGASASSSRRVRYEIQSGDFIARVAREHGVSVDDIVRWNEGLDPDHVRIGQVVTIYPSGSSRRAASESIGSANRGRLVNAEQLPSHSGYRLRDADRAWGTNETIAYMTGAFDYMRETFPDAPRVRVHDLSYRQGGRMRGHRSHQSGRDADISLYQTRCSGGTCPFRDVSPSRLDVRLQWALLRYWIRRDQVEYIFLDYELQEPLYEYVRDVRGATEEQLDEWFQYPHGRRAARGLIRHEPNHADHIHVRFSCASGDDECR